MDFFCFQNQCEILPSLELRGHYILSKKKFENQNQNCIAGANIMIPFTKENLYKFQGSHSFQPALMQSINQWLIDLRRITEQMLVAGWTILPPQGTKHSYFCHQCRYILVLHKGISQWNSQWNYLLVVWYGCPYWSTVEIIIAEEVLFFGFCFFS